LPLRGWRGDGAETGPLLRGGAVPRPGRGGAAPRADPPHVRAREALRARRRGAPLAGGGAHPPLRPLQGRGPAGGGRAGGGGDLPRGLQPLRGRDPRAGGRGRGGAPPSGGDLRPRVRRDGFVLRGTAEPSLLHAARGVPRDEGPRGAAPRGPREDRRMAARAGGAPDAGAAPRAVGAPRAQLTLGAGARGPARPVGPALSTSPLT